MYSYSANGYNPIGTGVWLASEIGSVVLVWKLLEWFGKKLENAEKQD